MNTDDNTQLAVSVRVSRLSIFAKAILFYSLQISDVYFSGKKPKVFTVRVLSAYFPFSDVIFDSERSRNAWQEILLDLKDHLTLVSGMSFPELSDGLVLQIRTIRANEIEKALHATIEKNLTLGSLCGFQVERLSDPILSAYEAQARWEKASRALANITPMAEAYMASEVEPLDQFGSKMLYLHYIAQMLNLRTEHRSPKPAPYGCIGVKAHGLLANSNMVMWLCCVSSESDTDEMFRLFRLGAHNNALEVFLVCTLGDHRRLQVIASSALSPFMAVVITQQDVLRHFLGRGENASLSAHVLSRLPLSVVSPYGTNGAARETFVGRKEQLDRILQSHDTHFAVIGPRKIGKTSLLEAIERIIASESSFANTLTVRVDASDLGRPHQFQECLYSEFSSVLMRAGLPKQEHLRPGNDFFRKLSKQIDMVVNSGKEIVFLFDEIDPVLSAEHTDGFEPFCRAIGNRRKARLIVFGYTMLSNRIHDGTSYIYNLFEEVGLGPLEQPAAMELVITPMSKIGISYENLSVAERIVDYCSRIPWLIQLMCQFLVEKVSDIRLITPAAVDAVYQSTAFTRSLLNSIRGDKSVGTLPLLIIYVVAKMEDGTAFDNTVHDYLRRIVYEVTFSEVRHALLHLTSTYILKSTSSGYRFFIERQKQLLNEFEDIDETILLTAGDFKRSRNR